MLGNISTTILAAILLYHSLQYYKQWQAQKAVDDYRQMKKSEASQPKTRSLHRHVVKISERAYVAIGYSLGNSIMLIGETGLIIIDTTESYEAAEAIFKEFRKISDKPVQGIIYTHNHADHVLGTKAFIGRNESDADNVEIWAHHTLMDIYLHTFETVGTAHYIRSMHQFGGPLVDGQISVQGYTRLSLGTSDDSWIVPPNKLLYTKEKEITLAGINLRLLHIPGETDDEIAVYWSEENILFCGDDFYNAFPNLYAVRGSTFRSLKLWYDSLDTMRHLHAEKLVASHTKPIFGKEKVYRVLTDYRDAVQIVHDQTVRHMNSGLHPDEIADIIRLPKSLQEKPYLKEHYGTVKWSSKGLFSGYMGWFSGDIADLNPYNPNEQAKRFVKLAGGVENMNRQAQEALDTNDPQWALRLSSYVLRYDSTNQKAKEIKGKSLYDLAALQTSMNGHNYYVTCAEITLGKFEVKVDPALRRKFLRKASIKDLFKIMSVRFEFEECQHIDKVVKFIFPDVKREVMFHVRNGLMDLNGIYERDADVKVTIGSVQWREILTGDKYGFISALTSELTVEPGIQSLQEIMSCVSTNYQFS